MKDGSAPIEIVDNLDPEEAEAFSHLCTALGHPVRVKMLQLFLGRGGWVCGQLVDRFPLAQSTISEYLRILLNSELIKREVFPDKDRHYCINNETLKKLKVLTAKL